VPRIDWNKLYPPVVTVLNLVAPELSPINYATWILKAADGVSVKRVSIRMNKMGLWECHWRDMPISAWHYKRTFANREDALQWLTNGDDWA